MMSQKEQFDKQVIYFALQKIVESKTQDLEIHFVYAGLYYHNNYYHKEGIKSLILNGMQKYKIKFLMVTAIGMNRIQLMTKETMDKYCLGEVYEYKSVNDDLESLFENLCLGKKKDSVKNIGTTGYFFPNLTREELKMTEKGDENYLATFLLGMNADVDKVEMKLSESDAKFVFGRFTRTTYICRIDLSET